MARVVGPLHDMCNADAGSPLRKLRLPNGKPAVHATPLNHPDRWVDDLPQAVEWMTASGVRFVPGDKVPAYLACDSCPL